MVRGTDDPFESNFLLITVVPLDDGSYAGRIPVCKGVVAFAGTRKKCETDLRSVLEEWIVLGLRLRHRIPVLGRVDLNL